MDIPALLKSHFHLEATEIVALEGYGSSNFKVSSASGTYVLKVYKDPRLKQGILQTESTVLQQLENLSKYNFPYEIGTVQKRDQVLRLHQYVEGHFLSEVPHTKQLLTSFGQFLGKLDREMAQVDPNPMGIREIVWDLQHFMKNRDLLGHIPEPKARSLLDYFFLQFEELVLPLSYNLRKSLIHNDANDWNVLTQEGEVSGIIDFGDMSYSWLINELAVAITYVMMDKEDPLQAAVPVISGYHKFMPLEEQELDLLYYLVAARLCTSVCNSAYTKTQLPDSDYITISERPAWALLHKWLSINPIRAARIFRQAAGLSPVNSPAIEAQLKRRDNVLSKSLSLSYEEPIPMYRSAFQYMYDTEGNTFLDAYNNIMITGHCHPHVVRAGQRTMARLNTNTRYVYEELLSYSELLLEKFPKKLNKVFLVNSGSAATDLALRMAKFHTGRKKVAVLEEGYHGNTQTGVRVSHYKYAATGGEGRDTQTLELPLPKVFGTELADDGKAGDYFGKQALEMLAPFEKELAAFIAEPIVGCGGQVPLPKGYLRHIYPKVRQQGGLCISDETQVGFGRLGEHFWGFERYGVVPDLVILGKPIGNGHPIGAVVTTEEIAGSFEQGPEFFSSFGGNPVSCAIGQAVLEVIEKEGMQDHARLVGNHLKAGLHLLQTTYPEIADVRGSGLFLGVEIKTAEGYPGTQIAKLIKNELRRTHILIGTDGPFDHVLKIKPPLSFSMQDADILCAAIHRILEHYYTTLAKKR